MAERAILQVPTCILALRRIIVMNGERVSMNSIFVLDLAVFEPGAKHTFDAAAGKNIANPTAALLASAKLLQVGSDEKSGNFPSNNFNLRQTIPFQHVGFVEDGARLKKGVERVLKAQKVINAEHSNESRLITPNPPIYIFNSILLTLNLSIRGS